VRADILVVGILIAGFGIVAPTLGIPLNTLSSGPVSTPTISCGGSPATCMVSVTINNPGTWGGTQSVWFWVCVPSLGTNPNALCGSPGSWPILENERYNVNLGGGAPVTLTETLACQSDSVVCATDYLPLTSGLVYSVMVQVYAGPPYSLESTSKTTLFTTTGGATTTTFSSSTSGQFSIFYLGYITLTSVSPPGSGVSTCTGSCAAGGLSSYTATWTPGTSISLTATFNSVQYNVCWEYVGSQTCTPIKSGTPFTMSTEAYPGQAILQAQTSTTQPVTISTCVSAPNPCNSSDIPGSWSPASATLSSGGTTQATFTFTAAAGYACPTGWTLFAPQANSVVAQGSNPCEGVTLTWQQVQGYETIYGTLLQLISTGSVTQTSALSLTFGGAVTSITCSGSNCPTSIMGPITLTFLAFCGQFVICQSVAWTVNGNSVPGNQNGMTYSFTTSQNYVVSANGVAPTGCYLSTTTGGQTTTTCNSSTTSSTSSTSATSICLGATCVSGFNAQSVIIGFGGLIALVGLILPAPGKKASRPG
jgi:hypothetical protein